MRSLRLRFSAILISAIVIVVMLATSAVYVIMTRADPDRMVWPAVGQTMVIARLHDRGALIDQDLQFDVPAKLGPVRADLTEALQTRLADEGINATAAVHDMPDSTDQVAVVRIGDTAFGFTFTTNAPPPKELTLLLGCWLGLVVIGVIAVSLIMAYRITQPFTMLEQAIGAVGDDGVLPHVPEKGSGEARQMAAALNRLSTRLRSAMESRMRLVAAAGHDLRTPMTRMRIRAEFLSDEDRESWSRDLDELELIADSAIRLVQEEVSWNKQDVVALDLLVTDVVTDLKAQGLAVDLDTVDPVKLPLPANAMRRALRNLLINAATHGKGGTIALDCAGNAAVLTIRDRGPGIPPHLLDRVFEPFFRAEPGRIQNVPGAGLGLAIAREIVMRAGGTLSIANGEQGLVQTISFIRE